MLRFSPSAERVAMSTASFLCLLVLIQGVALGKDFCTRSLRTRLNYGTVLRNDSLEAPDGTLYPKGTYWSAKRHWWACPCLSAPCTRICPDEIVVKLGLAIPSDATKIKIHENGRPKWVLMKTQFKLIKEAPCGAAYKLEPEDSALDEYHLLTNGSIYFPHPNISNDLRVSAVDQFCIIPREGSEQTILICNEDEMAGMITENLKFKIYPAFFIVSAIFLLMTLVAYFLTPDHNTVHGRSIVCQSGSLLITYIGFTINYLSGEQNHIKVCIVVAYITYYFLLASFFWLNVMCIDIYLTFRGSMIRQHEHSLVKFGLYAWGTPLIIFIVTVILDFTTQSETFSPGVGLKRCWFQGFVSDLLYYIGPVLILLVLNMFFFGSTALGLWRLKRESKKTLKTGDSRVHSQHDKDRLVLYVKLFLLMGVTWIMEIVSWIAGGPSVIWFITDTVNCLRGVLIFWFCVWSDKSVRKSLKKRFGKSEKPLFSMAGPTTVYNISSRVTKTGSQLRH